MRVLEEQVREVKLSNYLFLHWFFCIKRRKFYLTIEYCNFFSTTTAMLVRYR